jgi:hypothetical protein
MCGEADFMGRCVTSKGRIRFAACDVRGSRGCSSKTTRVVGSAEEVTDGVMLTVTESGFDRIPLARRAKAFTANEGGWGMVVKLIEQYVCHAQ